MHIFNGYQLGDGAGFWLRHVQLAKGNLSTTMLAAALQAGHAVEAMAANMLVINGGLYARNFWWQKHQIASGKTAKFAYEPLVTEAVFSSGFAIGNVFILKIVNGTNRLNWVAINN